MKWQHCGKRAVSVSQEYESLPANAPAIEVDEDFYLVRSQHMVPYYAPSDSDAARMKRRRERLNIELCNRVFRISDARDVARRDDKADAAIAMLQESYEASKQEDKRGVGRVLFGRIVARIRDLSRHYSEQPSESDLDQIRALYSYVMVVHPEIFDCVRLYDHSVDRDGIIEEAFSEIGKTQTQALEDIYASRAAKIGSAMNGMRKVEYIMSKVMYANPSLPLGEVIEALEKYVDTATRLVGFPANDYEVYDSAASQYVDAFDAVHASVVRIDHLNVARGRSHKLAEWLSDGMQLIHSMQNIRDVRDNSIGGLRKRADEWL